MSAAAEEEEALFELHDDFLYYARTNDEAELRTLLASPLPLDLNWRNEHGNSALHMAAANGHADLVDFLLRTAPTLRPGRAQSAVDVNATNALGNTPLAWAAQQNQLGTVRRLLAHAAAVNCVNARRQTPLDLALLAAAHDDVCNALVAAGAKAYDSLQLDAASDDAARAAPSPAPPDDAQLASIVDAADAVDMDDDDDDDNNDDDNDNDNDHKPPTVRPTN